MKNCARAAISVLVGALTACAGPTSAIIDSVRYAVSGNSVPVAAKLNPDLRYLRVTVSGRAALLVLGYVEDHPQGPIQVWYSAQREVLRLQNGRIVGAVGLPTEWRNVTLSGVPAWSTLAQAIAPARILRLRDVMPGYRYGVEETLVLRVASAPARSALQGLDPLSLSWFEESVESDSLPVRLARENSIPASRYAVAFQDGAENVVYSEQCLSRELCLAWQRWPAVQLNAKESR